MNLHREINRLSFGLMLLFLAVAALATYWTATGTQTILTRDDNPRILAERNEILRGTIYDRNDTPLAETVTLDSGVNQRRYHFQAASPVTGYYSLQYGEFGAESAYNDALNADDASDLGAILQQDLLHIPPEGGDVQLALDAQLQQLGYELMGDHSGALVLLSVPEGDVLAMVSLPTFDPNTLDDDWETLLQDDGQPFFNRVLQGRYQPGGMIYTVMLTAALIDDFPVEEQFETATATVDIANVTLNCLESPPADALNLFDALTFGCPSPFIELFDRVGPERVQATLQLFRPGAVPTINGFVNAVDRVDTTLPEVSEADAVGQGDFQTSPLEMATFIASFINNGNAPRPRMLLAQREPDTLDWSVERRTNAQSLPITTQENARRVQALLRSDVLRGTAQEAFQGEDYDIGGHTAVGYAGDSTHAWFVGFLRERASEGFAVAVVLEDSTDRAAAATIGGEILREAADLSRDDGPSS